MQQAIRSFLRTCLWSLIVVLALSSTNQFAYAQTTALPVPTNLQVRQDDRVATLQWNVQPNKMPNERPANVAGYRIVWGPVAQPDANVKLTIYNILQLQPIVNGEQYVATVQAVDNYGKLSASSAPITFTGDPARVNALRARMNGFFDDFNTAQGAPDELKWNTAYSLCNAAWSNGYFINNQSHVHNSIFTENCDRGQQINRARVPLDLSDNGTRTIVFDFDGVHRRNHWYIDLVPELVDIAGPSKYKPGTVRFTQENQGIKISIFGADGVEKILKETNFAPYPPLDYAGVMQIPNVRRAWEIQLRKDYAQIRIDGKVVLATDRGTLQLQHNRFHVLWSTFSYNTPKANQPLLLVHWDNFGFDAPVSTSATVVTHNYKVANGGTDFVEAKRAEKSMPVVKLNIPDPVDGAVAQRLMFTLQMKDHDAYAWSPSDRVIVNNQAIPIPQPVSDTTPPRTDLVDSITPYTVVLSVPAHVLRQGENTLTFDALSSGIHNIHVEFDVPAARTSAYTSPSTTAAGSVLPVLPNVGPNLVITQVGGAKVESYIEKLWEPQTFNPTVGGVIPVTVQVGNAAALEATGTNAGVMFLELWVDKRVVMVQRTDAQSPAPSVQHTFQLDTRQFTNGMHELYVRAYDPRCTPSITDFGGAGAESGKYVPLHFTTQNQGARATQAVVTPPPSGGHSVNIPMAMISNVAACANMAKPASSTLSASGIDLPTPDPEKDAILRREDDTEDVSARNRFFICD